MAGRDRLPSTPRELRDRLAGRPASLTCAAVVAAFRGNRAATPVAWRGRRSTADSQPTTNAFFVMVADWLTNPYLAPGALDNRPPLAPDLVAAICRRLKLL
jgi:hypothetical protein